MIYQPPNHAYPCIVAAARRRGQERRVDPHHQHAVKLVLAAVLVGALGPEAVLDERILEVRRPKAVPRQQADTGIWLTAGL